MLSALLLIFNFSFFFCWLPASPNWFYTSWLNSALALPRPIILWVFSF